MIDRDGEALIETFVAQLRPASHAQMGGAPTHFEVSAEQLQDAARSLLAAFDALEPRETLEDAMAADEARDSAGATAQAKEAARG